jgi:hypothetical protein
MTGGFAFLCEMFAIREMFLVAPFVGDCVFCY